MTGQVGTLLLITPYLPPHLGGVERYVSGLARSLAEDHGWRVVIAAPRPRLAADAAAAEAALQDCSVRVHWLPVTAWISNTPWGLGWRRRIRRIVQQEGVDIVNAHAPVPWLADMAARAKIDCPFILTYHTGPLRKGRRVTDALLRGYERWLLVGTIRRAQGVICASAFVDRTLPRGIRTHRWIIPPAVDPNWLKPGGDATANRLLFVGSLDRATGYKGLGDLLEMLPKLREVNPGIHLEIVGAGDNSANYRLRVAELGLASTVQFSGPLDGSELLRAYRGAAVVVLPSRFDNFPTVLVEALAVRRPVVAYGVGAVPELLGHGSRGLVIPDGAEAEFRAAILAVLDDPVAATVRAEAGRAYVVAQLGVREQAETTARALRTALRREPAPIRVAIVVPYFAPHIGGVEKYTEYIARGLQDRSDVEVVVVTSAAGATADREVRNGLTVIRLGTRLRWSNTPLNPAWYWQLREVFRTERIDVIQAHSPVPFLADIATLAAGRRPVVLTYHSGSLAKGSAILDPVLKFYERTILALVFRRARRLVAVSTTSLACQSGRAELISPGVDVQQFKVRPPPETQTVLYVGRIQRSSAWKGVQILIEAFAEVAKQLPDARLALVGTGDAVPEHVAAVRQLGLTDRVDWQGQLVGDELAAAYQSASVVVLPSLSEAESFGMTLIEAMASGRPVIGSRIGGIPSVIRDEVDGLLVPPGEIAALSAACVRVLQDRDLAARWGRAGRAQAETHYGWATRVDQHADLLLEVVRR